MERNIYAALLGLAGLGLLLNFEWLFLTFILLAGGLFLAERFSSRAPSFQGAAWSPGTEAANPAAYAPQPPIVIQSATQSPGNTMMMDLISNMIQESTLYHRSGAPIKKLESGLGHKLDALDSKLKKLKKMEKQLKHIEEHIKKEGGHH